MNDTLTIFKEANIQSKEELLCSLKNLYEEFRTDDSILQSKKVLLMDFIRKIEYLLSLPSLRYTYNSYGRYLLYSSFT